MPSFKWVCLFRRGFNSPELITELCKAAIDNPNQFAAAALANISNTAAMAGRCPVELFEAAEQQILRYGRKFDPKAVSTFAKAFAEGRADLPKAWDELGKLTVSMVLP